MKRLELLGKGINVDTDKIATGLKEIFPNIHMGFGIFEAEPMQLAEKAIRANISTNFDAIDKDLFASRIDKFVSECMHEITVNLF